MATTLNIDINDNLIKRLSALAVTQNISIEDAAKSALDRAIPTKHNKRVVNLELNTNLFRDLKALADGYGMSFHKLIKTLICEEIDFNKEEQEHEEKYRDTTI